MVIFKKLLPIVIIFFGTLHSVYFYQIKLAPFPIIGFLLLLTQTNRLPKALLNVTISLYVIFIINAIFGLINSVENYYFNSILGALIGPFYFLSFYNYFRLRLPELQYGIYWALLFHIIFFYIQFCCFHLLGVKINYLQMITGEESRVEGVGVLTELIRCSGLCNEPASYSMFVNLLSFYLITIRRKINLTLTFALISCFLSFSVSGMLFSLLNVIYYNLFIVKGYSKFLVSIVGISLFSLIFSYFYYDILVLFFESRFVESEDASLNTRFNDGFKYFFEQDIFMQITGLGLGNYPKGEVSTVASGYMAIFVHLGYLFTALFIVVNLFLISILRYKWFLVLFFFLFLSSTMTILNIHYWMFFAIGALVSRINEQPTNSIILQST